MNLIYITGATCTGKTTLANKIGKNSTIISLDAFSKSIRFNFGDFELYDKEIAIKPTINNDRLLNIIKDYITCLKNDYPKINIIVEGCHFTPDEFICAFPEMNKIIALGITDFKMALSRINQKGWIKNLDVCTKAQYAEKIIEYSLFLKEKVSIKNYTYIEQ